MLQTETAPATASPAPTGRELAAWTIKAIKQPRRDIVLGPIVLMGLASAICLGVTWNMWGSIRENLASLIAIYCIAYGLFFGMLMMVRQKTVFHYRLTTDGAEVEHYLYFPDWTGSLFRGTALGILLLFFAIAVFTGSLLFMLGPVAMAIAAALRLLSWKNEVTSYFSPWAGYDLVIIDRRQRMLVVSCVAQPAFGLQLRCPDDAALEQHLQLLRSTLTAPVTYLEEPWPW